MGTDASADYQQLGERLDEAAEKLEKSRRRASKKGPGIAAALAAVVPAVEAAAKADLEAQERAAEGVTPGAAPGDESGPDGVVAAESEAGTDALFSKGSGKQVDLPTLEALLFTTRHPLTSQRIGELIDVASAKALRQAIGELNRQYEASGRSFRIEQVAGGYQMLTLPQYGVLLNTMHQREIDSKLSRSALETLAIIAYKQPVLRAEVEAIRGVASGETIRNLMEKHLVKIAGRAEEPGRPILYGTTKRFLEIFGLNSIKDLPKEDQTKPLPAKPDAPAPPTPGVPTVAEVLGVVAGTEPAVETEAPAVETEAPAAEADAPAPVTGDPTV